MKDTIEISKDARRRIAISSAIWKGLDLRPGDIIEIEITKLKTTQ